VTFIGFLSPEPPKKNESKVRWTVRTMEMEDGAIKYQIAFSITIFLRPTKSNIVPADKLFILFFDFFFF